jgi:hypothetical protein
VNNPDSTAIDEISSQTPITTPVIPTLPLDLTMTQPEQKIEERTPTQAPIEVPEATIERITSSDDLKRRREKRELERRLRQERMEEEEEAALQRKKQRDEQRYSSPFFIFFLFIFHGQNCQLGKSLYLIRVND